MIKFKPAPTYYRLLNGIICVFKPEGECAFKIVEKLQGNLSRDLNSLLCYNFGETTDNDIDSMDVKYLGAHSLPPTVTATDLTDTSCKTSPSLPSQPKSPDISLAPSNFEPGLKSSLSFSPSLPHQNCVALTNKQENDVPNTMERVHQADNAFKLIFGERYIPSDFKISHLDGLSKHSTGVMLLGVGNFGRQSLDMVAESKLLRVYHVKGRFGYCTQNFSPKGKFIERASFRHVTQSKIDKICASAQAAFSREMYRYTRISPDSQEAYELAASGIIRPAERHTPPIVYGIKCIHFQPPDFTLEVHTINERCHFLNKLIHDMAVQLKSRAVCTGVRRLRYGYFEVNRALVRSQWNLENIIKNIEDNQKLIESEMLD